jgi:membrane protein DedA with SNARE-associated domain
MLIRVLGIAITVAASISSFFVFMFFATVGTQSITQNWHQFEAFVALMLISFVPLVIGIAMIIWGKR